MDKPTMLLLYHMITLLLFWSNAVWRNHDQMSWSEIVTLLFFHPWLKSYPIKEPVLLATTLWISGSLGVFRYLKYRGQIKSFINDIFPTRRTQCLNFILVCFHQPPSAPSIFCFVTDLAWLTIYRGRCRGSVKTQVGLSALWRRNFAHNDCPRYRATYFCP